MGIEGWGGKGWAEDVAPKKTNMADSSQAWSALGFSPTNDGNGAVSPAVAARISACDACVKLRANTIAVLPLVVYKREKEGHVTPTESHDVHWLLNHEPHKTLTATTLWQWMVASMLYKGDGLAQILRNGLGDPIGLLPLPRESVVIRRNEERRALEYLVFYDGKPYGLTAMDVLHFPGFGFNGVHGESVISRAARSALGSYSSQSEYAREFFKNAATPSVTIEYPAGVKLTEPQIEELRRQFAERYTTLGNRHLPLVLKDGGQASPISISQRDSQLLESRMFEVEEIARAFLVPPPMIGVMSAATSFGTGLGELAEWLIKFTCAADLKMIAQECTRKLFRPNSPYYVEHDIDYYAMADTRKASETIARMLGGNGNQGYVLVNELRRKKKMPPVDGGDKMRYTLGDQNENTKPSNSKAGGQGEPDQGPAPAP